ncbi:LamG domain-containing protein [Streptomyces bauhiniae]|uniref:LamG domain-containing protein n=1 Tax=Streptomyces bauhiniae TaxID=2340725 RepID=UPI0035DD1DF2
MGGLAAALLAGLLALPATAAVPSAAAPSSSAAKTAAKSAPTEAAATTLAADTGKNVEITSLRDESSETFATPSGDREVVQHLRAVRARVGGTWKAIDNTLEVRSDGSVGPTVASVGMSFSGGGANTPLVRLDQLGRTLSFSWPEPLPKPVLSGDTATYPDVLPGVDLTLRADTTGFHDLLVVSSAEAAKNPALARLTLGMQTDGLDVREAAGGGFEALDEKAGGVVFAAPKPIMWDSTGPATATGMRAATMATAADDAAQGPGDASQVAPIDLQIPADGGHLQLTPDQQMLTDAKTTWPVYIDPHTDAPKAGDWTMVSRYWHDTPQYRFNGESNEGLGLCEWDYCAPYDLKRLFYKLPTAKFAGKTILSAEFIAKEVWSASCDGRAVELWRTKSMGPTSTWDNTQDDWLDYLTYRDVAFGGDGCSGPADVEFNALDAVKYAASHGDDYTTFGLKAKHEDDKYGWKRFTDDAYLRVTYNLPPQQIKTSQLSMSHGGDCDTDADKDYVRSRPSVTINGVTDPDGDRVRVRVRAYWDASDGQGWKARWTSALTTDKSSGSPFTLALTSSVPTGKKVAWAAQSYDGAAYSPWSWYNEHACYFWIDNSVPAGPDITSGDYPPSDTEDPNDPWYDGVGRHGNFTFGPSSTDVAYYCYGTNGDPDCSAPDHKVPTTNGAAQTVRIAPTKPGLNFITVQAWDVAGNPSKKTEETTYRYRAKAGQPARAQWKLDEPAGATQTAGTAGDRQLAIHGQPILGSPGAIGAAATFDGVDDYLESDIPVVDTSQSFSVAAWAKLSATPNDAAIIAAQPGNSSPGFELYYSKALDRWAFNQYSADTASASPVRAMQAAAGGVKTGEWVHLVGLYNGDTDVLQLYVNGALAGSTSYATPWDARRGLIVGAGSASGAPKAFFPGTVDEVRVFDKPLAQSEITALYRKQPIGSGRPARAVFPLDEGPTDDQGAPRTTVTGRADVFPAVYQGGPQTGLTSPDGNAAKFDGVNDYASAASPYINTMRNFSVSAWVKLTTRPTTAAIAVTQPGAHRSGFELYYSPTYGWSFNNYLTDTTDSTLVRAAQRTAADPALDPKVAPVGQWTHLTGVYSKDAGRIRLYLNGRYAGGADHTITWYASGPLQLGAARYDGTPTAFFPGQIDDVQVFDRMLSTQEISEMYKQHAKVEGRWKLNAASGSPITSADDVPADQGPHPLTLGSGATVTTADKAIGAGSLLLNGTSTGYASTAASPTATNTSFTAATWVSTASPPQKPVTVMSQAGTNTNGFAVRYIPNPPDETGLSMSGRFVLDVSETDSTTATHHTAESTIVPGGWTHLGVVYDAFEAQLRLYVNGELKQALCPDADDDEHPDDPTCTDVVAWNESSPPFDATKGLQLGRAKTGATTWGEYWPGALDDVWVFDGVLRDTQIAALNGLQELPTIPGP